MAEDPAPSAGRPGRRLKNAIIFGGVLLLLGLLRLLRPRLGNQLGRGLGRLAFCLAPTERRRTLAHLGQAFAHFEAPARRRLARQVFVHLGMGVAEVACADQIDLATYAPIDPESRRVLDEVLARGRGVVFVTAHCGNWELMARSLTAHGYTVNAIGQRSYDRRLTRLLADFRERGRVRTLWRGEPRLFERMLEVLGRGEIMGLLIDQDTRVPGVFVDFFGRPAWTPTAAAVLARKARSPVVMGFNHRRPEGGLLITVEELSQSDGAGQAVLVDTQAMTSRIEAHIRAHPAEWVWMHTRWRTEPLEPARLVDLQGGC